MRNGIDIYESYIINNQRISKTDRIDSSSMESVETYPIRQFLADEGGENFLNYIEWLGLDKYANPVILSSIHHYFYDTEELKNFNTVINLKELNQVKDIKKFLHSIFHNLSDKNYFIGCFVDNNKINGYELRTNTSNIGINRRFEDIENGIYSKNPFLNMLFSIMDFRTNKYMSKRIVSTLLNDHGFNVLDMTELNGLTYFCAQRLPVAEN